MTRVFSKLRLWLASAALVASAVAASAQSPADLRLNEVVFVEDSLHSEAWIEVFNSSYSTVDMQRLYLSNDRKNLTMFQVHQGVQETQFIPRSYLVFEADGRKQDGPFHTSFTIKPGDWIYLVESNGHVIIDSVEVVAGAVARTLDGAGVWETPKEISKAFSNQMAVVVKTSDKFKQVDPYGAGMALISISVVFSVLVMLALVFSFMGKFFVRMEDKRSGKATSGKTAVAKKESEDGEDDIAAAIAVAVGLYYGSTDEAEPQEIITQQTSSHWRFAFRRH